MMKLTMIHRAVVLLAAVSIFGIACNRTTKEEAPAEPPRVITIDERPMDAFPFTNGEDPAKDIVGAVMRLKTVPSWTSVTSASTGPKTKVTLRFASPNKYWMSGPEGELISISGQSWVKEKGEWVESNFPFGDLGGINPSLSMTDFNAKAEPKLLRREKVDEKDVSMYSYQDDASLNTMWIESETGLLIKTISQSTVKGNTFSRTTTYDYKTPVVIEPPQTVKK